MKTRFNTNLQVYSIVTGIVLWFLAALAIRFFGPVVFIPGSPYLLLAFLLSAVGAWVLIPRFVQLGGIDKHEIIPAVTLMTLTAALLDGVALTWFPGLYNLPAASLVLAAACLLWAVGAFLAVGVILGARLS